MGVEQAADAWNAGFFEEAAETDKFFMEESLEAAERRYLFGM